MAKKTTEKAVERTYNVPLRKEYMKAPRWKRTKKAMTKKAEEDQARPKSVPSAKTRIKKPIL